MSYWIRQLGLVVLGILLSGLPLEMKLPESGTSTSPSARRSAPEETRRDAESSIRLCVRTSVAPLEMAVQVRTQRGDGPIRGSDNRSFTLCLGAAPAPDERGQSPTDG